MSRQSCLPVPSCPLPLSQPHEASRETLLSIIRQLIAALEHRDPNACEIRMARSLLGKS